MATEVYDAFRTAWSYGPTSNPDQPDKAIIHFAGRVIDDKIAAVEASANGDIDVLTAGLLAANSEIDALAIAVDGASEGLVRAATWTALAAIAGTRAGQPGEATTDAGTHTDPVVGGTVANKGAYSWSTSPAGWRRVGDLVDATLVNANIIDVDTKLDALLAPISGQQTIGVTTPSAGVNAGASTYVLAKEVEADGVVTKAQIYASASGTVEVGVFSRNEADLFTLLRSATVSVVAGLNTIALRLPAARGNCLGATVSGAGTMQYIATANHGFFAGTLSGGAFTDVTASTTNELQLKFTIDQIDQPQADLFFTNSDTIPQALLKSDAPVSGAGSVSPGTVISGGAALSDGIIDTVELFPAASATVSIGIWEMEGLVATRVKTLCRITTNANVLNTIRINEKIEKGQFVGFQSATGAWTRTSPVTGEGYHYDATKSGSSFTSPGLSTAATIEARINIRRLAGQKHELGLAVVDRCLMIGPSYQAGHYNILGKNAWSKVSLFSDFNFEGYSYSGNNMQELLDRLRLDVITGYAPIHAKNMGNSYVFISEGYNSFNEGVTFADYQEDIRQIVETVKSFGAIPVLCSEWKPVYDASAHAVYKALAEELGVYYVDMVPHTLRNFDGTVYGDFTQGPTTVQHLGVRTNALIADQFDRFMNTLGRPANSMKLFRKRATITVTDIDDDLMFRNAYERAERFKEIYMNQVAFTAATEKYYDELTTSTGLYDKNDITKSEYLLLQDGSAISLDDYALLDVVINTTQKNVERIELALSDPTVQVYVKDALAGGTYPPDGASVCRWMALTGSAGVFSLNHSDLPGKMHFDKLTFLLYKSGGMTLAEPKITWWGQEGKPTYPIQSRPAATGAELLNVTKFATISGNKATGWDDVGGTITPSSDATYQLPYDITHFVNVDATKKVVQTLNYAVDNFDDIEVEIRVSARYFPAVFASSGTYPSGAPINQDSFDWRKVVVELIDPTGTYTFTQSAKVGLWWDEVVFRAILPMRVNPLDIRVSGSAEIQLAKVSVKRV